MVQVMVITPILVNALPNLMVIALLVAAGFKTHVWSGICFPNWCEWSSDTRFWCIGQGLKPGCYFIRSSYWLDHGSYWCSFLRLGPQKDSWIRGQGYAGWYSPKKNLAKISDGNLSGSWAGAQLTNLNVELMRYSDLLLMAAETEVEVGSLAKAAEYVDAIRTRAGNCAQGKIESSYQHKWPWDYLG